MQPEISRRCLVCGAAPRAGAHFCPQCGNSLSERSGGAESASHEVQPDARAGARRDGETAADETAREVASGEEVARAFEAWRGGQAVAEEEARPPHSSTAGDEARSPVVEAPHTPVGGESSRPLVAGGAEAPRARGPVMPEPFASQPASEPLTAQSPSSVVDDAGGEDAAAASSPMKSAGAVGATRRRAASVVKESIAPRVERVRDRSIVMLEEAPDDSGLRFVLIAAFMFALFIFLLVLSTVIK